MGEDRYFLTFHWLDGKKVTIYADRTVLAVATDSAAVRKCAADVDVCGDPSEDSEGMLQFHEFLLELTSCDVPKLESLENMIISLEEQLLTEKQTGQHGISSILKVRRDMFTLKRYYTRMVFLTEEMTAVSPSFQHIHRKFCRLLEFALHLQEYIDQLREGYQSRIDIEQNNIMKIFTVVTSIFLPLTLITGWYGMNLPMPPEHLFFSWPFVIGLSFGVIAALLLIFKKKRWF